MNWGWFEEHLLEMLFGLVSAGLLAGFKVLAGRLKKIKALSDAEQLRLATENKAMKEGLQALLRDRVIAAYDKYAERGFILVRELENVEAMYSAYHELGGNGTITRLVDEMRGLPHNKVE